MSRVRPQLCILLFLLALGPVVVQCAPLVERIDAILRQPAARQAFWGVTVLDLGSGQTVYQHNADHLFIPASNTKLFSTALALMRLGPEHRFLTRLAAMKPPDAEGRLAGDLVLLGGGDPNFSSRVLPYTQRTEFLANRLQPLEELAAQAAEAGLRQIDGDVVGDDTLFVWQRYPQGWAYHDTLNGDGAPVTALVINDNTVTLSIQPGEKTGDSALIVVEPPAGNYFTIENRTRTVPAGQASHPVRTYHEPGEQTLRLWGEIALDDKGRSETVAIADPALFAAQALRDALVRHSISVLGRAVSRHAFPFDFEDLERGGHAQIPPPWILASRSSMPLIENLRVINKASQNLHAEIMLRAVAGERRGLGSIEAAQAELKTFLSEVGIARHDFFLQDGSGLSRMNLVSPAAVVTLLAYMWKSPYRQQWLDTLPVGAYDGTLRGRFVATPAADRLRAKTGTLTHVSSLSGYIQTVQGRHLAFSILVNNYHSDSTALRALIDRICVAMTAP